MSFAPDRHARRSREPPLSSSVHPPCFCITRSKASQVPPAMASALRNPFRLGVQCRVEPRKCIAQALSKHHLPVVVTLRRGFAVGDLGAVADLPAGALQPGQRRLFDNGLGEGSHRAGRSRRASCSAHCPVGPPTARAIRRSACLRGSLPRRSKRHRTQWRRQLPRHIPRASQPRVWPHPPARSQESPHHAWAGAARRTTSRTAARP